VDDGAPVGVRFEWNKERKGDELVVFRVDEVDNQAIIQGDEKFPSFMLALPLGVHFVQTLVNGELAEEAYFLLYANLLNKTVEYKAATPQRRQRKA